MAYCVHCGVKLEDSEKKCPLCGTVVLDPGAPPREASPAYPVRTPEQNLIRNKRYLLTLSALLLLLPAALCLIIDAIMGGGLTWSLYPSGALTLLWVAFALPLIVPRYRLYSSIGVDFCVLAAYLFMVESLSPNPGWFLPVTLPALTFFALCILLISWLYRSKRLGKLTLGAAGLIVLGLGCLLIELLYSLRYLGAISFSWSPYAAAPCVFVGGLMFFINGNRTIREEVRRRTHF